MEHCGLDDDEMLERETYACEECGDSYHMDDMPVGAYLDSDGFHCGCSDED